MVGGNTPVVCDACLVGFVIAYRSCHVKCPTSSPHGNRLRSRTVLTTRLLIQEVDGLDFIDRACHCCDKISAG